MASRFLDLEFMTHYSVSHMVLCIIVNRNTSNYHRLSALDMKANPRKMVVNHRKTIGKPQENGDLTTRKMVIFHG